MQGGQGYGPPPTQGQQMPMQQPGYPGPPGMPYPGMPMMPPMVRTLFVVISKIMFVYL